MSLIGEIRRRKVFRVAVVYAATAFAVVEAAHLMLPGVGRTAEAEAYYESLDSLDEDPAVDMVSRWHALNYLGRHDEATELLRHYDDAGELFVLGTFLGYTFFDPRPYSNLSAALRRNSALRAEPQPFPYACPATGA